MAARIGSLRYDLGADTATLESDLRRARSLSKKYAGDLQKVFADARRSVNKYGLAFAGAATAGSAALAALEKKSLDFASNIVDVADKVGLSTSALQEYRFTAGQVGVAQSALDMGMQRFSRRVAEVAQGQGELKGTLEQYNIAVRDSNGNLRSNEAILNDLADAISGAESEQEQLRIAFKAFDSEGAALVNMLRGGSVELERYRQQARDLGLVLDEDLVRNAERTSDQLDILGKIISVNVMQAVLQLSPLVQALSEQIGEDLNKAIHNTDRSSIDFGKDTVDALRAAAEVVGIFADGMRGIHVLFKTGQVSVAGLEGAMVLAFEGINRVIVAFQKDWNTFIAEPLKRAGEILGRDWDFTVNVNTTTDFDKLIEYSSEKIENARKELHDLLMEELPSEGIKRSLQGVLDKLERIQSESANTKKALSGGMSGGGGGMAAPIVEAADDMSRAMDLIDQQFRDLDEQYARQIAGLQDVGDQGKETFSELENAVAGWASGFSGQLNDLLWEANTTFEDILRSFAKMITQMLIQQAVVEPMLGAFGLKTTANAHGNVFTGGRIKPFAHGGVVTKPTLFPMAQGAGLMGEAGPEAIMPLKRLPGGDLGVQADGMGGGEVTVQIIDQRSGGERPQVSTTREDGRKTIRVLIRDEVKGALGDGTLDRSMAQNYGVRRKGIS